MDDPLEKAVHLLSQRGGVITRPQVLGCGLTQGQLRTLLRNGSWISHGRGIYGPPARDDVRASYLATAAARVAGRRDRNAVAYRSAAVVLGLPLLGQRPRLPELVRAPRGAGDRSSEANVRVARLDDDDVMTCSGVVVTSPARTVVDIARTRSFREAVVVADAALHAGVPLADLLEQLRRCQRWPGARRAALVVEFADERCESPLESLDRVAFFEHGVPAPRTQVDVVDPAGQWLARVDFLLEEQRTVVESDGLAKYRLSGAEVPAWVDGALVREKERELALRAMGLEVVRNGWDEVFHRPADLCARVRLHFGLAARYPAVPGVTFRQWPMRKRRPTWPLG